MQSIFYFMVCLKRNIGPLIADQTHSGPMIDFHTQNILMALLPPGPESPAGFIQIYLPAGYLHVLADELRSAADKSSGYK